MYVAHRDAADTRQRRQFRVERLNWISGPPERTDLQCKLRHGPGTTGCRIEPGDEPVAVTLERPDPGIASGQHAVFYDGERCLGGGVIA